MKQSEPLTQKLQGPLTIRSLIEDRCDNMEDRVSLRDSTSFVNRPREKLLHESALVCCGKRDLEKKDVG